MFMNNELNFYHLSGKDWEIFEMLLGNEKIIVIGNIDYRES